ncbi:MAG: cystathionine beta-lyase [Pseudomonadota bacterium]
MQIETKLTHSGRAPDALGGIINPPVEHASTIIHANLCALDNPSGMKFDYGRRGTNTALALREAITILEGAYDTILCPSGASAVATALATLAGSGDHVLISDSVYEPTRSFCKTVLQRYGVEVEYFAPMIDGPDFSELLRANTALVFMEAPGSLSFEVQDVVTIAEIARKAGVLSLIDNTWSAGLLFPALAKGVDVSVQSITKYIAGHSDVMMGSIACGDAGLFKRLWQGFREFGIAVGPDDIYLALRGLRTLPVRLSAHDRAARTVASWLGSREEVKSILHPAFEGHPGHGFWWNHFKGANGLFGFTMPAVPRKALAHMLDPMRLFKMGYSWGGYESLILPTNPASMRTASPWPEDVQTMRLHIGLEHVDDLIEDLEAGFKRLNEAL